LQPLDGVNPSTDPVAVLVPAAGFSGAPFLAVVSRLQDNGVPFVAASEEPGICHSIDGVRVTASRGFDDRRLVELPALVLFGNDDDWLERSQALRRLLLRAAAENRVIGAVGRGMLALAAAGLLRGREVASDSTLEDELADTGAFPLIAPVALAERIITATDTGAAALADELLRMAGIRSLPIELR
jgi:putative intracellular protease/amidase